MKVDIRLNGGRKWNLIYFINFVETFKKGNHQKCRGKEEIEIRASSLDLKKFMSANKYLNFKCKQQMELWTTVQH